MMAEADGDDRTPVQVHVTETMPHQMNERPGREGTMTMVITKEINFHGAQG